MLIAAPSVVTAQPGPSAEGTGTGGPGYTDSPGYIGGPGYVVVEDGIVTHAAAGRPPRPADIELPDGVLAPGFVDLQVNGYYGVEFQIADQASWASVAARLPETGTTAFLPTMITAPVAVLAAALRDAASFLPDLADLADLTGRVGARVLGVHLEGPFISPDRPGAHNPAWITDPTPAAVSELLAAGAGTVRMVTLAPERPGALAAISELVAAGVLVSVGHSDALASQVAAAAQAGARKVTHLFNAQRPLGQREPGVVGQALTDPRLTCGLIADLHHVTQPACTIAFAAAPGRIALVTDAAACAGMPPGEYLLGGEPITMPAGDGEPPVRADGTIAGSALRMDRAVANAVAIGVPLPAAVAAATRIPADLIGRPDLGRLAPGAAADMVWLSPALSTRATWVAGRLAYSDGAAATLATVFG
jgi:N-acetylglucosamine-6-phosphate deacetylase